MSRIDDDAAPDDSARPAGEDLDYSEEPPPPMTHRQILEVLLGLVLAMFVAILSSTIVANALPIILHDLNGTQNQYTWVVAMTMLVATSSTPIWGKMSDLFDKKLLLQIALTIFVVGSILAGLAQNTEQLLVCRGIQGLGMGGLQSLTQVVMGAIMSPRQRGRYSGYLGASFAVGAVGGPLIGGMIVGTSWLGWRWCFYVCVPIAVVALVVLHRTLRLPHFRRKVKIDIFGSTFLIAGVSLMLIWVSLAGEGKSFPWMSQQTLWFVGGALLSLGLAIFVESRVSEPVLPLRLFANRTIALAVIASLCTGVMMMSSGIFLAEYFQVSLGYTPLQAGLLGIPMVIGLMAASTISGQLITRRGRWKRYLVGGMACCLVGFGGLSLMDNGIPLWVVLVLQAVGGIGLGLQMQNLVLAVQNSVDGRDLGAASSMVMFFRSMGGACGVSVLGAVLAQRVDGRIESGLAGVTMSASDTAQMSSGHVPKLSELTPPVADVVSSAYSNGMSLVFLIMIPLAAIALVSFLLIKEIPLLTESGIQRESVELAREARAARAVSGDGRAVNGVGTPAPGEPAPGDPSRPGGRNGRVDGSGNARVNGPVDASDNGPADGSGERPDDGRRNGRSHSARVARSDET